jgi:hypothetical protein
MQNMLAFEGIALGSLDKTLENSPANTTSLLSSIDFSGYITVKAAGSVWRSCASLSDSCQPNQ